MYLNNIRFKKNNFNFSSRLRIVKRCVKRSVVCGCALLSAPKNLAEQQGGCRCPSANRVANRAGLAPQSQA